MDESSSAARQFPLNLPAVDLRLRRLNGEVQVYDRVRDKYVALTPEEVVRQHFVSWLIDGLHYPASHISNEVSLKFNGMARRADTFIAGRKGEPLMVVEYKAPDVKITQDVFDQIARYNSVFKARYIAVSNGLNHYCCVMDQAAGSYHFIPGIPDYNDLAFDFSDN